jgi:Secretion system C-terminal sorting domain/The GLUG motif
MNTALQKNRKTFLRRGLALFALLNLILSTAFAQFNGGTGTESDPYQIANVTQLQAMNTALDKHFILTQNIDASETSTWNAGLGFEPIGVTTAAAFTGTFDGRGFVISKLYINRISNSGVGLFGNAYTFVPNLISIKNVGLDSVYVKGSTRVGALVGNKELGLINCYSSGTVEGISESVGGLIGRNGGLVDNCHSSCNVSGGNRTGGLIGTGSNVRNSYATGNVAGVGEVGGFIGGISSNASIVYNCYATGNVSATGNFPTVGGFIGRSQAGTIDLCYASGTVTAAKAAGFIYNANAGLIKRCYTTATVTSTANEFNMYLAGFIGENEAQIRDCYSLAKINYTISNSGANIVGFVGRNEDKGKIYNCYTSAKLNAANATRFAFTQANEKSSNNLDTGKIMFCYYNIDTTGNDPAVGTDQGGAVVITNLSDVLMRKQSSFVAWNFDTTWTINENVSYPYLRRPGAPCVNTTATDSARACNAYTWINGITYTNSTDTVKFTIPNAAGCDSIITLKLTIDTINADVSLNANVLSANENAIGTTYQWINCDTNTPITNAINKTYTATVTGNYAVIVSNNSCTDTSICTNVVVVGVNSISKTQQSIHVYPNPTANVIQFTLEKVSEVNLMDAFGRLVFTGILEAGVQKIDLSDFDNGLYVLSIKDEEGYSTAKILVKN